MKKYTAKQTEKTIDNFTFEVTAPIEMLNEQKEKLFPELAKEIKIPGFRPGKAPKNVIEEKLATKLFTESINRMLPSIAYEVIVENNLNPITNLEYSLKDFDEEKGVVFTFTFTNYPEIKLTDYSKIKLSKKEADVKDDEIETVMQSIIKSSLPREKWEKNIIKKSNKKQVTSNKEEEHDHDHTHGKKDEEEITITDELVAELGYEGEKTVTDLKKSIKEKLTEMKNSQNQQDYIDDVIKEAVKITKFEIPKVFVDREVEIMEANFSKRLEDIKLNVESYLASQGSTLEDYRKDWAKQAEERVRTDLILLTIASNEKLIPEDSDIDKEIQAITDPSLKAQYDNANGRDYIKTVMTKQNGLKKLMEMVEGDKKESKTEKKK